tara:strand:- start:1108 stop:1758 length:651 start_codon:yes stop_codon:yes gene_type:complete
MFGQPVASGIVADQNIARAGSNEILMLGENGNFDIVSPKGNIESVIENIKLQLELVALNNHLYITFSDTGGEVPSGIALKIKDVERMEDYQDDKEMFRIFEHKMYKVEEAIASYNSIKLPKVDDFMIDFYDIEYPMTTQDTILQNNFDLQNNLTTQAHILMKNNKDLDLEAAVEQIAQNKEINELLAGNFDQEEEAKVENVEENQQEEENEDISND